MPFTAIYHRERCPPPLFSLHKYVSLSPTYPLTLPPCPPHFTSPPSIPTLLYPAFITPSPQGQSSPQPTPPATPPLLPLHHSPQPWMPHFPMRPGMTERQ